jgi:hypothetical protein
MTATTPTMATNVRLTPDRVTGIPKSSPTDPFARARYAA